MHHPINVRQGQQKVCRLDPLRCRAVHQQKGLRRGVRLRRKQFGCRVPTDHILCSRRRRREKLSDFFVWGRNLRLKFQVCSYPLISIVLLNNESLQPMNAAVKTRIQLQLADRFGHVFEQPEKRPLEILPTGIAEIDHVLDGFPRGAITEIYGAASCGRTSILLSALAAATSSEETCALVDCSNTFDLSSAADAGVSFDRLLWVRGNHNLELAFKAVDLLLHGGGFGFIVLNLADMPAKTLRRIVSTWWFRFRRAIENTPTVLAVATPVACVRSCAAMALELKNEGAVWPRADFFVTEEEQRSPTSKSEPGSSHLWLVPANDRYKIGCAAVHHSHLLQALTVRVNRERPRAGPNRTVRFTPHARLDYIR